MSYDLNDPEQVKQYLEDLGTEYRFGCYSEKDPQGNLPFILFSLVNF